MMYKPSNEQLEILRKVEPWKKYKIPGPGVKLADDAPEEIKELFPKYLDVLDDIKEKTSAFD